MAMLYIFDEIDGLVPTFPPPPNRAQRRAHTKRIAANRRKLTQDKGYGDHYAALSDNALAVRHPLDCGKKCFMCHGPKLLESGSRRQREKRAAMAHVEAAWG